MLKLTANRETQIHKASEQAAFARTVVIGKFYITYGSVVDGHSSTFFFFDRILRAKELSISSLQAILDNHV